MATNVWAVLLGLAGATACAAPPSARTSVTGTPPTIDRAPVSSLPPVTMPANQEEPADEPWDRFGFAIMGLLTAMDSSVRLGPAGLGVGVDLEELLGFESTVASLGLHGYWRFTESRKHRVDLSWTDLSRRSTKTLANDLDLGNGDILPQGSEIASEMGIQLFRADYSYSLYQDDRADIALIAGLYVAPVDFKLAATGITTFNESFAITAPLPLAGLRMDFAITPKVFLRTDSSFFYVKVGEYKGSMTDILAAVEWQALKHFGLGLGYNAFRLQVERNGATSVPGVGFTGRADFAYTGIVLYLQGLW